MKRSVVVAAGSICLAAVSAWAQVKAPAPAPAASPGSGSSGGAAGRREIGALVVDGIPEIPARIPERIFQYQNARTAVHFDWAPDGKGLLIGTRFAATQQVHFVAGPGGDRQQLTFYDEPVSSAFFDDKKGAAAGFYLVKDVGGNERGQLFWYDKKTGRHTLITDGKSRNESFRMARGGGKIAFVSTARNNTDFDIYLRDGDAQPKLIKETKGQWAVTDWSPDGKTLLLLNYVSISDMYLWTLGLADGQMVEVNPQGGKQKIAYASPRFAGRSDAILVGSDEGSEFRQLTLYELKTGKRTTLTGAVPWDVERIEVAPSGKTLAYVVNQGGQSVLYVGSTAAPGKAKPVALPAGVIGEVEFDRAGQRLGLSMSSATSPSDVYVVDARSLKAGAWTASEVGGLDRSTFVAPTLIETESFDKLKIPAWVYRPRAADAAGKRRPVVVAIHGGPEAQAQPLFNWFTQYLVNELGIVVIEPNVRGSSGYGKSHLLLDNGMKRQDSVKDIGAILDWIGRQPDLDPSRVAVYGGSYGGFMVLASLIMFEGRLKCGVDIVGISHLVTFLNNTEDYRRDLRRVEYGDERDPKMKEFQHAISPLTNAAKIKAPLFVIQGQNDPRVPASEAEQMVKTVRQIGGRVWYLLAKDEGHGFRKKPNRDFMTNAVALFFEQYLI
jgi:dipeptidyl aminopeptidase/acylaminoacyl peptidase